MANLAQFAGRLPYASELFGVYQPLMGWRSRQKIDQLVEEQRDLTEEVVTGMIGDPRLEAAAAELAQFDPLNPPADPIPPQPWSSRDGGVAEYLARENREFVNKNRRSPSIEEWQSILAQNKLQSALSSHWGGQGSLQPTGSTDANAAPATQPPATVLKARSREQDVAVASLLGALAVSNPVLVAALLRPRKRRWETLLAFRDPLADFDPATQLAVLSPVGLVHLYRQYFFELESFLGSPVGHVWISPGGTLELVEVSTRRTQTERFIEIINETTTRAEKASMEQDEIADAVKEDNERNINLGITASGGFNLGVVHGEATASFGL